MSFRKFGGRQQKSTTINNLIVTNEIGEIGSKTIVNTELYTNGIVDTGNISTTSLTVDNLDILNNLLLNGTIGSTGQTVVANGDGTVSWGASSSGGGATGSTGATGATGATGVQGNTGATGPPSNQTLEETLINGNSAGQKNITSVNNLDVFTINGGTLNQGLNSVLNVSNVAGGLDIDNVGTLTANKVVELGRESKFGYINPDQVKIVTNNTPFQIDISGGTLTLDNGSYLFNFKVNFSSSTSVGNYTLQLFLDAVKITESLITPTGGLSEATLAINSIPVTITGATGVVSLKGLVSTAPFANVTIQGSGASYYSYLEIYKGVLPPPLPVPLLVSLLVMHHF